MNHSTDHMYDDNMGHLGHDMGHMEHNMNQGHDMHSMSHDGMMHGDSPTDDGFFENVKDSMNEGVVTNNDVHNSMSQHGHSMMSHGAGGMSMSMTFHGGYKETILFSWWDVNGVGTFAASFIAIFIMALMYEGLKYYRKHLLWKTYTGLQYCAVAPPDKGVSNACAPDDPHVIQPVGHIVERKTPTMVSREHGWQTLLHALQVLVSYALMLVFMTYNTWLCAAVVLGSATGYFLFGWRESVVVDFTEHCH